MLSQTPPSRRLVRTMAALAGLIVTITLLAGVPARAALSPAAPQVGTSAARAARTPIRGFSIATLNEEKGMRLAGLRHDIRVLVRNTPVSVIGFQERLNSKPLLRRALPQNWRLLMKSSGPTGTDDNPIAYNSKVWELKKWWVPLLTANTWRRWSGRVAYDEYATVAVLRNRRSGQLIRAVSLHLPNHIHNRRTGGPDWSNRGAVEAMWRMAASVRRIHNSTPANEQVVITCDCNVTASRDRTRLLVRGKIIRPLGLATNYSVAGYRPGWRIDYVMADRGDPFRIVGYRSFRNLATDHPGFVARFKHR